MVDRLGKAVFWLCSLASVLLLGLSAHSGYKYLYQDGTALFRFQTLDAAQGSLALAVLIAIAGVTIRYVLVRK